MEEMIDKGAEISSNQIQYSLLDRRPDLKMNEFLQGERGEVVTVWGFSRRVSL